MFWIPIAAVLLFACLCSNTATSLKDTRYRDDFENYQRKASSAKRLTGDLSLEQRIKSILGTNRTECVKIIRDFMGGGKEWAYYASSDWRMKAVIIEMAKAGKLPCDCTSGFCLSQPDRNLITPECGLQMNREFLLGVESFLRERFGYRVTVYASSRIFDAEWKLHYRNGKLSDSETPLQYGTRYQFIEE